MAKTTAAKMGNIFGHLMHDIVANFESDVGPLDAEVALGP